MYKRVATALAAVISLTSILTVGANSAQAVTAATSQKERLSKSVDPNNYKLTIEPDIAKGVFSGTEKINIHILDARHDIVLNSAALNITSATIIRKSKEFHETRKGKERNQIPLQISLNPALEQVKLTSPELLVPGTYELDLSFNGKFDDKLRGFFLASYKDDKGVKRSIACTQMEPTDARRMFPCFDEPALKATYDITAVIDQDLTAISNSSIFKEEINPSTHKKTVVFAKTPKISSYLVALVVGNFASTEARTADGVPIRIWAIKGKEDMGQYALEIAAKLLPYMNRYFGVAYPGKKLDLIAIPDFGPGAMENLGAITFKESALLVDEKTASTNGRQIVAAVIAHEMAHQWFGDLVTTSWWDDIWLNEAFASWFGTKAVDYLRPDWRLWDGFGRSALWTDSLNSTRAIHANVKSPEQAIEMFDDITYVKGSAVLRMLERYVGPDTFQRGVHLYMKTHAFKTATTEDLWWAIATSSSKPISEMMHTWIYQPGYPLVSVNSANNGKELSLRQERFLTETPLKPSTTKWMVPVALKTLGSEPKIAIEMLEHLQKNVANPAAVNAPCFVNADAQGFYRVLYSPDLLSKVEQNIYNGLTANERYCLLTDSSALAFALRQPIADALRLTLLVRNEEDPFVVPQVTSRITYLRKYITPQVRANYQQYIQNLLLPQKHRLSWQAQPNESDLVQQARGSVLSTLGTYGQHQPTIAEARALFAKYRADRTSIAPNLVNVVLNIVSYNGSAAEYDQVKQLWQTAKTPESEETCLMTLANFQKPELIQKTLALTLSKEVHTQDRPRLLSSLLQNDINKRMAWSFIKLHWTEIVGKCPPMALDRIVGACRSLDTIADEKDLRLFFAAHKTPAIESAVARTLEDVHLSVRFRQKNGIHINNYMRDKLWQK